MHTNSQKILPQIFADKRRWFDCSSLKESMGVCVLLEASSQHSALNKETYRKGREGRKESHGTGFSLKEIVLRCWRIESRIKRSCAVPPAAV
jgi:hypothetical protein